MLLKEKILLLYMGFQLKIQAILNTITLNLKNLIYKDIILKLFI